MAAKWLSVSFHTHVSLSPSSKIWYRQKLGHKKYTILTGTHTHTHPFNGPLSGTTRVSRYQKGKTNLDFTEARDSEWQWHKLGHMQVCTSLQTDNHTSTPPLSFLQAGCPSCRPTNSVKALKALNRHFHVNPGEPVLPPFSGKTFRDKPNCVKSIDPNQRPDLIPSCALYASAKYTNLEKK